MKASPTDPDTRRGTFGKNHPIMVEVSLFQNIRISIDNALALADQLQAAVSKVRSE